MKAVDPQAECTHDIERRIDACKVDDLCPICLDDRLRVELLRHSIEDLKPPTHDSVANALLKREVELLWRVLELVYGAAKMR